MSKEASISEEIQRSIELVKSRLTELEQALEQVNEMRFKEGDVAFHKSYGNCVIQHVLIETYPRPELNLPREGTNITGYHILHREGASFVKERELMPITEMAKTLYSKS